MKNGKNAALNGGRGSGQTIRRIAAIYEEKIADLKAELEEAKKLLKQMQCSYVSLQREIPFTICVPDVFWEVDKFLKGEKQ